MNLLLTYFFFLYDMFGSLVMTTVHMFIFDIVYILHVISRSRLHLGNI